MAKSNGERHAFQAEVSKLLDLMAKSLYREKEIFLRELISNASDACDKLRYSAITQPELLGDDAALAVTIKPDSGGGVLVVADNGIGMSREELIDNLGTIARSGTEAFV
ncbi:MAG: ATP-binding protein, partial [Rhodospirillales bacterium]|nr:ATP-binding protein [Rhodospirillales bacterium]